jgi:hypothetical protein
MDVAFAFLDLLGFTEYAKSDLVGAARLLESQREILSTKLRDAQWYQKGDTALSALAHKHLVTGFDHFLPFSDSILITGKSPTDFIQQLSTFLIAAFSFTGHAYADPENPTKPEEVTERIISSLGTKPEPQNWFPALWRGGVTFGRVELLTGLGMVSGAPVPVPMLIGTPVAEAVALEKNSGKGPRLFCVPDFKSRVAADLASLFRPVAGRNCDEFLWPALSFHDRARPLEELGQIHQLLLPAVTLFKAKKGTPVEEHYFEFVRLIVRSALAWGRSCGVESKAHAQLVRMFASFNIDLLDAVFS